MRVAIHPDVHEPPQEHARDAGLASDSRLMAQVPADHHGSADFAAVMVVLVICLAALYLAV